jgi:hypothetical protein
MGGGVLLIFKNPDITARDTVTMETMANMTKEVGHMARVISRPATVGIGESQHDGDKIAGLEGVRD